MENIKGIKIYSNKHCDKCSKTISYKNWSRHLKTYKHQKNDVNESNKTKIIKPKKQRIPKDHRVFHMFKTEKDILFPKTKIRCIPTFKETAFESRIETYDIENNIGFKDPKEFLSSLENIVLGKMKQNLMKKGGLKVNIRLICEHKKNNNNNIEYQETNFKTENEVILKNTNLKEFYINVKNTIFNEMQTFVLRGSNWTLNRIIRLELNINKYNPLRGSSYVKLPNYLKSKKAIINIKNTDNKCFLWSLLSALHYVEKNACRVSKYKQWEKEFDNELKGIDFPVKLEDIQKFEKKTKNVSINVYMCEKNSISILHKTKNKKDFHIHLLYFENHYCWIKDLWKLVGNQITKHDHKQFLCDTCLCAHYKTQNELNEHQIYCDNNTGVKIVLPKPYNNITQFKNYNNSLKIPFAIYADFECKLQKIHSCQPNDKSSYTNSYQKHIPTNFVYYVKYANGSYKDPVEYSGPDAPKIFYQYISEEAADIAKNYYDKYIGKPILTSKQLYEYENAKTCYICEKRLKEKPPIIQIKENVIYNTIEYFKQLNNDKEVEKYIKQLNKLKDDEKNNLRKVLDHDHLTGNYRGAAHSICNLNYKNPRFIPIFFHNLAGYDAHLFIKEFGDDNENISLIPNTEENYISFSKNIVYGEYVNPLTGKCIDKIIKIRFLDSFKFMSSSLNKLANNLEKKQFIELTKHFPKQHLDLVTRKLAYPYEYMDCDEKYEETSLPSIDKFYSSITNTNVTEEEYKNAQEIWKVFNIQNLKEFTNLYNKIDVLLLTDIMENFRDISLKTYKLDPAWYYTIPGFAWDCMLRMTNVKLELLTDYDMNLLVENGLRGGLSQCSNRYSKANNKYMENQFNSKKESVFLEYLDANNLYGWAMSKYLPYGGFKWINTDIDIMNVNDESPKGYILEVDLKYPKELHDLHNDFPLAPENKVVNEKLPKLLTTLYDKKKYVIHYSTLKKYISLGLKLEKIHKVLEFDQSNWLKSYIDFNTNLRALAKNEFEKDYYKLMNNSVFGKTMENKRNHVDIRLVSNSQKLEKLISKPNFDKRTIFTENLVAVHMKKTSIMLDKPTYVGMTILDLSKTLMYDFYYNTLKKKYVDKIKLLYTDTDSLILEIKTDDFYEDIKNNLNSYDTSDYPLENIYNIPQVNKKIVGKFKDELNGVIMTEFVGLRSKLYSYKVFNSEKEVKKAKGVKKYVVEKFITHKDFRDCLISKNPVYRKQNLFRTKKHNIFTVEQNKKALSAYDDKRCILENSNNTLAWGHNKINIQRDNFLDHIKKLNKRNLD